jgi:hypothetical protein
MATPIDMKMNTKYEWISNMKITKQQLKQIIKEELSKVLSESGGAVGNVGGVAQNLGAMAGRREPPPLESEPDTVVRERALEFFMNLGLEKEVADAMITRMAVNDLKSIMIAIPKIGTAAQDEDREHEV